MKVVALAGGTGSAKLLRGLEGLRTDLAAVVNVGDNAWMYGAYVCPDIDVATYALAGIADRERGWGIEGDTFETLGRIARLGAETWFRLGDMDLATCLVRTEMMRGGATLTEATEVLRAALGVSVPVLPVTDSEETTWVRTPKGWMHLQEFWVREKGRPKPLAVAYRGARRARVSERAASAILGADRIAVCPANPGTSIGPMLAIPGFVGLLRRTGARVVALSPMAGCAPYSGPAGKLMKGLGVRRDSLGVATLYSRFLDAILIAEEDAPLRPEIESLGMDCETADTLMAGAKAEVRLAGALLKL